MLGLGILETRILGPSIDDTLTGERYLEFLEFNLIPALALCHTKLKDPEIPNDTLWYQQDGAPAHYTRQHVHIEIWFFLFYLDRLLSVELCKI